MPRLLVEQYAKVLYKLTASLDGAAKEQAIAAFAQQVIADNMRSKLPYIIDAYEQYVKKETDTQDIEITTAYEVPDSVIDMVKERFGREAQVTTIVDKTMKGGIIIKKGNTIFDSSVDAQLATLHKRLVQ